MSSSARVMLGNTRNTKARPMALHVRDEVAAIPLGQFKQMRRADVHRRRRRLQMQEQCVEPRQRLQLGSPLVSVSDLVMGGW